MPRAAAASVATRISPHARPKVVPSAPTAAPCRSARSTSPSAIIREARHQIELEKSRALREIRGQVADLSVAIASKLLARNVSKEDNERLVRQALEQLNVRN